MNKNLCIRRAIKRNRFGAQRDGRMGPNPSDQLRSPIKQGDRRLGPVDPAAARPVEESFRADIRRLERDRRRIVAAKFIPLTHSHGQTRARMEGLYRPAALSLFGRRNRLYDITLPVEAWDIRFIRPLHHRPVFYCASLRVCHFSVQFFFFIFKYKLQFLRAGI